MATIPSGPISPATPTSGTESTTPDTGQTGVNVLVNGKAEYAGTATTTNRNGRDVTTIVVDQKKMDDKLAAEGQRAVLSIPVSDKSDVFVGKATYTLPAQQINIDSVSAQMGKLAALKDINVQIEIAAPTTDTVKVVENAAERGNFTLVVPPVEFSVRVTFEDKTIEVSTFEKAMWNERLRSRKA